MTGARDTVPITLFDYGVGNLHSIKKALEGAGATVTVTTQARDLLGARAIVLPGVGAFGACMEALGPIRDALKERLESGLPCLAVCIGMHVLFEGSAEDPDVPGVGFFQGRIEKFPRGTGKVPHMGWNEVRDPVKLPAPDKVVGTTMPWQTLLPKTGEHVYYVHSYFAAPERPVTLRETEYGVPFAGAVAKARTLATQFHPEKSSTVGLRLITRWVDEVRHALTTDDAGPRGGDPDPAVSPSGYT